MGFLSRFEGKMEDVVEGAAGSLSRSPISPVQISKKCERNMMRNKMVGAGKEYAPTLYTVFVNGEDDRHLFSFYPTLAGETETYLKAAAARQGLYMDGQPLVRFIVDSNLGRGRFDVIAEVVASSIIKQLRQEEMERYGLANPLQGAQRPVTERRPSPVYAEPEPTYDPYDSYDAPMDDEPLEEYPEEDTSFDPYAPRDAAAFVSEEEGFDEVGGLDAVVPVVEPEPRTATPEQTTVARLIDLTNNKAHLLQTSPQTAGRANGNDIIIPDINASRNHAEFSRRGNTWSVRDLGSKNGTQVNGNTIRQAVILHEGDRLTMGLTDYLFTQA